MRCIHRFEWSLDSLVGVTRRVAPTLLVLALLPNAMATAQTPDYPGVGGTPTAEQVNAIDIAIGSTAKSSRRGAEPPKMAR